MRTVPERLRRSPSVLPYRRPGVSPTPPPCEVRLLHKDFPPSLSTIREKSPPAPPTTVTSGPVFPSFLSFTLLFFPDLGLTFPSTGVYFRTDVVTSVLGVPRPRLLAVLSYCCLWVLHRVPNRRQTLQRHYCHR